MHNKQKMPVPFRNFAEKLNFLRENGVDIFGLCEETCTSKSALVDIVYHGLLDIKASKNGYRGYYIPQPWRTQKITIKAVKKPSIEHIMHRLFITLSTKTLERIKKSRLPKYFRDKAHGQILMRELRRKFNK